MSQLLKAAAGGRERKFVAMDVKRVAADGTFTGYASLFNREDLGGDVIAPGAFAETLSARGAGGIRMLFQHDAGQPIGVWTEIAEDQRGLRVAGHLMRDVARAQEVLALMRAGAIDGLSIGYRALRAKRSAKSGLRRIERIDLWEISIVTFPMLPGARIEEVKTRPFANAVPTPREFERWLTRDAGLTRREARAVMATGLPGLQALRDASGGTPEAHDWAKRFSDAANRLRCN